MAEAQAKLALHVDSRANQGSGVLNVCTDIHDGRNFKPPRHPGHRVFRAGAFFRPRWFSCWGRSHKKGAGVTARTLEDSSLNEPSANLGRLLAAAAQSDGSETCQRQQRPAWLRHGTDVTNGDGVACHGLNVSRIKGQGFRCRIPAYIGPAKVVGRGPEADVFVRLAGKSEANIRAVKKGRSTSATSARAEDCTVGKKFGGSICWATS